MTAFIAEGKRLGIPSPLTDLDFDLPFDLVTDDEGLCVTGCAYCREFRNKVREALNKEALQAKGERYMEALLDAWVGQTLVYSGEDMDRAYDEGRREGYYVARRIADKWHQELDQELTRLASGGR